MSSIPSVSIILPTFNRLERLKRVVAALERQKFSKERFEVIVISDGSTDGTDAYLQALQTDLHLVPIFQRNQGPAAARNAGLAKARGELILFLDDDVIPVPQLLDEHVRSHQLEPSDVAVIGPMLSPQDFPLSYWVRWGQEKLAEQYDSMVKSEWEPFARQFYTGNASFPRRLYLRYGGFDEAFHRAEDVELAYRYEQHGVQFRFNPQAIGYHYEERSFQSWKGIAYSYGRFDAIFASEKNYAWLFPIIFREFRGRPLLVRWMVLACLGHGRLGGAITQVCKLFAGLGNKLRVHALQRAGCSAIFNMAYYQGVADEVGGRKVFFEMQKPLVFRFTKTS